jgi:hypothetical protein
MLRDPKKEATIEEELFHAQLSPAQRQMLDIAQIFKQRGWCQNVTENAVGNVCLFGAVERTGMNFIAMNEFANYVLGTSWDDAGTTGDNLIQYNDAPGQTMRAIVRDLQYCALG